MSEWQPIETAPDSGCFIVITSKNDRGGHKVALAYRAKNGTIRNETGSREYKPTHWMPLPDPPVS